MVTVPTRPVVPRAAHGPHLRGSFNVVVTGRGATGLCSVVQTGQPLCLVNFHGSVAESIGTLLASSIDESGVHAYSGLFEVEDFPSATIRGQSSALLLLWHFTLRDENRRVVMSVGEESVGRAEAASVRQADMEIATQHLLEAVTDRIRAELELTLREPWAAAYR
jgi:hypothetical protein